MVAMKFCRQVPIGPFFADFACLQAGLIVELDGGQHFEPEAIRADASRTRSLVDAGYTVLRYTNQDVMTEFDAVLTSILNGLEKESTS